MYRQRGVEPPSQERLEWVLHQATTKLLESHGQQHDGQKIVDDLYDDVSKDTLSDAGAKPRIKRTRTQSSQASHESTELSELTSAKPDNDPKIISGAIYESHIPKAIATDSELILAYLAAHPESRRWTLQQAMQNFIDNPPPGAQAKRLKDAMQFYVDHPPMLIAALQHLIDIPPDDSELGTTGDTQAYLEPNRQPLKRKRAGELEAELEGVEEVDHDDEFEGFED